MLTYINGKNENKGIENIHSERINGWKFYFFTKASWTLGN